MALAYPKLPADAREEIACDHFTNALNDPDFALKIKERVPTTLDEALRLALRLEAWAKSTKMSGKDDERHDRPKPKVRATGKQEQQNGSTIDSNARVTKLEAEMTKLNTNTNRQYEELKQLIVRNQQESTPVRNTPTQPTRSGNRPFTQSRQKRETQAFNSAGESTGQVPAYSNQDNFSAMHPSPSNAPYSCWKCGMSGHYVRNCPSNNSAHVNQYIGNHRGSRGSRKIQDKANVYVKLTLFGKDVPCLVDTGSETTIIPKTLLEQFRHIEVRPPTTQVWATNGTEIQIEGETRIPFCQDNCCLWTTGLISEDIEEVMLGIDWLEENDCLWDFRTGRLTIKGRPAVTLSRRSHIKCRRVIVQEYQEIPPRSQVNVTSRVTMLSPREPATNLMVETRQLKPGLYVGRTLLEGEYRDQKVCMANTTSKPLIIPAGTYLGQAVSVKVPESENSPTTNIDTSELSNKNDQFITDIVSSVLENLPDDVDISQRKQIVDMLHEYEDIFSTGTYDMGRTTLVEHTIDTGSHRPIRQALRRHPRAHLDEIDHQVDGMLQNGLVEPAASPWASNVVLVKKKDGSFRLCVDYRRLNTITYRDSYPLPHIDTCLGSMNGSMWFSTLDLRSGYHNIPIADADKDKTAFITRRGCFRYKVMPFGLTCAPSVFQRLMDLVLCGLTYETCLVYLDDIILFSQDFDSHMQRLQEIFSPLRAANLKLHAKKCHFFQQRVDFLGHVLSKSGVQVQPDKVKVVQNWPVPRNVTEVRSFIGLCSYYRRFIPRFADIAGPLHMLTRKNARFNWGPAEHEAFCKIKERLISAPILGMPCDEGTYYLDTDASDRGIGAVLSQEQNGQEVVIAYASRTLSRPERNYDVTRRELLAVVYGLKAYRQYLLGREFVI